MRYLGPYAACDPVLMVKIIRLGKNYMTKVPLVCICSKCICKVITNQSIYGSTGIGNLIVTQINLHCWLFYRWSTAKKIPAL